MGGEFETLMTFNSTSLARAVAPRSSCLAPWLLVVHPSLLGKTLDTGKA